jgi:magnesium-transporting ATPase (P-type)
MTTCIESGNIGVAMGKRELKLQREAADLILIDDDLSK